MPFSFKGTNISDIKFVNGTTTTNLTELSMNGTKVWGKRTFTVTLGSNVASATYSYVDAGGYTKTGTITASTTFSDTTAVGYDQDFKITGATAATGYSISSGTGTFGSTTSSTAINATINKYTVTISVNNSGYGSVSSVSVTNVPYGTVLSAADNVVSINGTDVTATSATATAQYTYSFLSWTNGTATVTSNLTVTANFNRVVNKYYIDLNPKVTLTNLDGSTTTSYASGYADLLFNFYTPYTSTTASSTKVKDFYQQYDYGTTYKFTNVAVPTEDGFTWTAADDWVVDGNGIAGRSNATPTATKTRLTYTVSFSATDYGTWGASSKIVNYGDKLVRDGNTVTCYKYTDTTVTRWTNTLTAFDNTAQYTYTATASGDDVESVTANATFGATSTRTTNTYTITWSYQSDYGTWTTADETYTYGATPSRTSPSTVTSGSARQVFSKWDSLASVTGDRTITAVYTQQYYVTVNANTGCTATTNGTGWYTNGTSYTTTWTVTSAAQYTFNSTKTTSTTTSKTTWTGSSSVSPIASPTVYTRQYTITWKYQSSYGTWTTATETYDYNAIPSRTSPGDVTSGTSKQVFSSWDSLAAVTADRTITATYTQQYQITWKYYTSYETYTTATQWYNSGATPSRTSPGTVTNSAGTIRDVFSAWDSLATVTAARTITATYTRQYYITVNTNCNTADVSTGWHTAGTKITWTANSNYAYSSDGATTTSSKTTAAGTYTYTSNPTYLYATISTDGYCTVTNPSAGAGTAWYPVGQSITWTADSSHAFTYSTAEPSMTGDTTAGMMVLGTLTYSAAVSYTLCTIKGSGCTSSQTTGQCYMIGSNISWKANTTTTSSTSVSAYIFSNTTFDSTNTAYSLTVTAAKLIYQATAYLWWKIITCDGTNCSQSTVSVGTYYLVNTNITYTATSVSTYRKWSFSNSSVDTSQVVKLTSSNPTAAASYCWVETSTLSLTNCTATVKNGSGTTSTIAANTWYYAGTSSSSTVSITYTPTTNTTGTPGSYYSFSNYTSPVTSQPSNSTATATFSGGTVSKTAYLYRYCTIKAVHGGQYGTLETSYRYVKNGLTLSASSVYATSALFTAQGSVRIFYNGSSGSTTVSASSYSVSMTYSSSETSTTVTITPLSSTYYLFYKTSSSGSWTKVTSSKSITMSAGSTLYLLAKISTTGVSAYVTWAGTQYSCTTTTSTSPSSSLTGTQLSVQTHQPAAVRTS